MSEYHKIVTVFEREPSTKFRTLLEGRWATPEFAYLHDKEWEWTEKVDGTNIRIMWDGANVSFGGKTDQAQLYTPLLEWMNTKFYAGALARALNGPAVLYGEGYGAKIQKGGGNYRSDVAVVLFDVHCGNWLSREAVHDIANKLEVEHVPVVGRGTLDEAVAYVKAGQISCWGSFLAEGLIMRPLVELLDKRGQRIITKVKHKDFSGNRQD